MVKQQHSLADEKEDAKLDAVLEAYDKAKESIDKMEKDDEEVPDLEQPTQEELELEQLQKTKEQKQ